MNTPEHALTLQDQGTEPLSETTVHVQQSAQGVVVEFRNDQGINLASSVVELHNGCLKLYAWDEKDEQVSDPTVEVVLVQDCGEAKKRVYDDQGKVVSE